MHDPTARSITIARRGVSLKASARILMCASGQSGCP